jgi:hypothetical protein
MNGWENPQLVNAQERAKCLLAMPGELDPSPPHLIHHFPLSDIIGISKLSQQPAGEVDH